MESSFKLSLFISISLLLFISCHGHGRKDIDITMAGENVDEIRAAKKYFERQEEDEVIDAGYYLLDNMRFHSSDVRSEYIPDSLRQWLLSTDSIFLSLCMKCESFDNISKAALDSCRSIVKEKISSYGKCEPHNDYTHKLDLQELSSDFIVEHVNHAYKMWKTSPFASNLSFEEFKEYILPYRAVNNYGFLETGQTYHTIFSKYVLLDCPKDVASVVRNYNQSINNLRDLNGKVGRKRMLSYYDLYSRDHHDCTDIANYGVNILRACGIPTALDFNISYRDFVGRHYFCAVMDETTHRWLPFNPESSLPGENWDVSEDLNIYRQTFGAQYDTPYFQRGAKEKIPSILSSPCIKDVTSNYKKVYSITLDVPTDTHSRLAYLTTFNRSEGGTMAVTWCRINTGKAKFNNVVPNVLYFPMVYTEEGKEEFFSEPFFMCSDGEIKTLSSYYHNLQIVDTYDTITLYRKYPRKSSMRKKAEELVGGQFIGSNDKTFKTYDVLYEITEVPESNITQYPFSRTGKYKYYRYQAPVSTPHANISILEWNYDNTTLRLSNGRLWKNEYWKAEYDGNMQTAPCPYPNITLELEQAEEIDGVSFAPINADNGIKIGNRYELMYWQKGWQSAGNTVASSNEVIFKNVPSKTVYWLINHTEGKEESPFLIINGEQQFLYKH